MDAEVANPSQSTSVQKYSVVPTGTRAEPPVFPFTGFPGSIVEIQPNKYVRFRTLAIITVKQPNTDACYEY